MPFFIPFATSEAQPQRILHRMSTNLGINDYASGQDCVYESSYRLDGLIVLDTIGKAAVQHNELALAISRTNQGYFMGTYSRDVIWGKPMIAHVADIR